MSFNDFKEFFAQLFTALDTVDSFMILLFLLVAFLIGWLFGRLSLRSKYRKLQQAFREKETELITVNANYTALQDKYAIREEELQAVRVELEELEASHRSLEAERGKLNSELYAIRTEVDQLKTANTNYENEVLSLKTDITALEEAAVANPIVTTNEVEEVDLGALDDITDIRNNYESTIQRLAQIEDKLAKLEGENATLKNTIETFENTDVLTIPAISEEEEETSDEKAVKARLEITRALGNRIEKVAPGDRDDLKQINGIGPFIEEKLNEIGIYTFRQISQFDESLIELVTDAIQFFPGRILRDDWVGQAKKLK